MVALAALKLWLVAWQDVGAEGSARFDDALFIQLAQHFQAGDWLGPYNERTLIKGPVYPLWIAVTASLGLPLLTAQHLLHAAAAAAIAFALRRVVPNSWARLALFVALLLDPATYEITATRVTREGLYTPLAMLVVAGLIEIAGRKAVRASRLAGWSVALGLCIGAYWLTREEGPWLVPAIAILIAYAALGLTRAGAKSKAAAAVLAPAVVACACIALVAALNYRHYGVATVVELKSGWFTGAYGALARVGPDHYVNLVPVPKPSRELAYSASPAFAELRLYLDGEPGAAPGPDDFTLSRFGDMTGTWFIWALRDAAAAAGHHKTLGEARDYYRRLANEIDAACEAGAIPCGPPRASLAPPWRSDYLGASVRGLGKMSDVALSMRQVRIGQYASVGEPALLRPFEEMSHMRVDGLALHDARRGVMRLEILNAIRDIYALALYPLTALAAVWLAAGSALDLRRRTLSPVLAIAWAVVASIGARIALLTYISVSSYPIYQGLYLRVLYPLLYLVVALCAAHAAAYWKARRSAPAKS